MSEEYVIKACESYGSLPPRLRNTYKGYAPTNVEAR